MAGFVIECLLKALLLERHPNLQAPVDPATLSPSDKDVLDSLYSHDLDDMLGFLPELENKLSRMKLASRASAWNEFRSLCEQWTVHARYSSAFAKAEYARWYVYTVKEIKKWLREL